MERFEIPHKISSDYFGYNFLSDLNYKLFHLQFEEIVLDFSKNSWFEANLCAILGAIINSASNNLNNVSIEGLPKQQENAFSRNHFLASFGGTKIKDKKNTTIKYRRNKLTDEKLIKEFVDRELINKPDFPKLSDAVEKEIVRSIFEIYSNAIIHGGCEDVYSCGQFYPQKHPPRIDFTIVDLGKTIKKNVSDFLKEDVLGTDAIEWALQENNTTKPKVNNIPGGLGLKLIADFIELNNGKLQIISSDGFLELSKKQRITYTLNKPFPGTIVNMEFNLDDESFYYLDNEIEDIIF